MKKNYQTSFGSAGTTGWTTSKKAKADAQRSAHESAVTLPDAVSVAVGGELEEGLLAFAVGAGLQVLGAILPTDMDMSPNAILEAMACGLPIVL